MSSGLVSVIKEIAMEAVDNSKMPDLRFGTVVSASPLKIRVTNQFILPSSMLIVPQHLTDYEIEITTSGYGWLDNNGDEMIQNNKKIKVHGALKSGDKVALMRKQGGQSYFVLDRLVE